MTKQHFEALARFSREHREQFKSNTAHAEYAADLALELGRWNPRFDRARFILACMPSAWVGSPKSNIWERLARR